MFFENSEKTFSKKYFMNSIKYVPDSFQKNNLKVIKKMVKHFFN